MTGKDLLNAMNYVEEELVENCMQQTINGQVYKTEATALRSGKSIFTKAALKWGAVAAAALIFLGGGVAYAAKYGLTLQENYTHNGTAQYRIDVAIDSVTIEQFTGELKNVEEILKQQAETLKTPSPLKTPPTHTENFASVTAALEYIGYAELKAQEPAGTLDSVSVRSTGDENGQLGSVELLFLYQIDDMMFRSTASLYTHSFLDGDFIIGGGTNNDEAYVEETYVNKNGKSAIIMSADKTNNNYYQMKGYLTDGAVLYQLDIHCYDSEAESAREHMYQWLDQF